MRLHSAETWALVGMLHMTPPRLADSWLRHVLLSRSSLAWVLLGMLRHDTHKASWQLVEACP